MDYVRSAREIVAWVVVLNRGFEPDVTPHSDSILASVSRAMLSRRCISSNLQGFYIILTISGREWGEEVVWPSLVCMCRKILRHIHIGKDSKKIVRYSCFHCRSGMGIYTNIPRIRVYLLSGRRTFILGDIYNCQVPSIFNPRSGFGVERLYTLASICGMI